MNGQDRFEIEVSEMLSERAKVDRSTVEQARASIAALPDRKSTGRTGTAWRGRPSLGRSPMLSLVGVGALVVAVVAVSLFGRFGNGPVATSSATPSSAEPTIAATLPSLPSHSFGPDVLSTRQPTPAFRETLPVAYTGNLLSAAGWSPDGSHFAIVEFTIDSGGGAYTGFGPMLNPTIHIFDKAGVELEALGGWDFAWLDASSYVVLRQGSTPSGAGSGVYLGRLGSSQSTLLGNYESFVAGPSGAVALMLPWDRTLANKPQYVVLSGGSASQPRDGYPAAWSRDGSMLAVFHPTNATGPDGAGEPTGWLEVVRSTGEHVVSADKIETSVGAHVAFSPDGARVAFRDESNPKAMLPHLGVLEVPSGRLTSIQEVVESFTWADNNDLLFVKNNTVVAWSATTSQLSTYGTGDLVAASGRGVVVLGSDATHALTWTNTAPGAARSGSLTVASGPSLGTDAAAWSPDGKSLIVVVGEATKSQFMDAVIAHF
jgi:hypothetical protein